MSAQGRKIEECFDEIEDYIDVHFKTQDNYQGRVQCVRKIKECFIKEAKEDAGRHGAIQAILAKTKDEENDDVLVKAWDRGLSFMMLVSVPWHESFN